MLIQGMHHTFKERFNRLSSNFYMDFSPMQIDQLIDEATHLILELHASREDRQMFFDMLSPLLVSSLEQPPLSPDSSDEELGVYEFRLSSLKYRYFYHKRTFVMTDCGLTKVEIVGHGVLSDLLSDALNRPSKKWRRLLGTFQAASDGSAGESSLFIYSEPGFAVEDLRMEYYRYPNRVFFGGYNTVDFLECVRRDEQGVDCASLWNNVDTPARDCEISENYHTRVVEMAVLEAQKILGMQGEATLSASKLASMER